MINITNPTDTNNHKNQQSNICIPIIGYHRSPLSQKFGIPRQPNLVNLPSHIEMLPPYGIEAFVGIEEFSHLWLTWQFHQNRPQANFRPQVRPPRLGGNQKMGVFATRSMYRPSMLGLSVVKLLSIQVINGKTILYIRGADMVNGTPIVDIKPYIAYSDAIVEAKSGFAPEKPNQKKVIISEQAKQEFQNLVQQSNLTELQISQSINNKNNHHDNNTIYQSAIHKNDVYQKETKNTNIKKVYQENLLPYYQLLEEDLFYIMELIAQDPRPAYQKNIIKQRYTMRYKKVDVDFCLNEKDELFIMAIRAI